MKKTGRKSGFKHSKKTRVKMSLKHANVKKERNPFWKGGKNRFPNCKDCSKKLSRPDAIRCRQCDLKFCIGSNGKNYKNGLPKCIDCNKELGGYDKRRKRCWNCFDKFYKLYPEKHWHYINGNSKFPYSLKFNSALKAKIRKRDNYTCQLCEMIEEEHLTIFGTFLTIHHIDYDKQNCKKNNLITLCFYCNSRVNFNRKYWTKYFKKILRLIKIKLKIN